MRVLFKTIYSLFLRLLSIFTKKPSKSVLFIPHKNCKNDGYDIINYHADNVLSLLHYLLEAKCYSEYIFYIVVYDVNRIEGYKNYIKEKGYVGKIIFVLYDSKERDRAYIKSNLIFTDNYYEPTIFKLKKQTCVCLGYFAIAFKDDYFKLIEMGKMRAKIDRYIKNISYDNHISTSDLCSRELALDSQISFDKFIALGFPRNDVFFVDSTDFKDKVCGTLGFTPKNIIVYAPTHRDYERQESNRDQKRSIFGWVNNNELLTLENFLEETNSIIIAKIHPRQQRDIINDSSNRRIVFMSNLVSINANLQLVLSISDLLITDYSSTFYDYLLLDRPIVHYCYDYDEMSANRGFFINPVDPFFAGDVVKDFHLLPSIIKENLLTPDKNKLMRERVRSLVYKNVDGYSAKRIADHYFIKD